MEKWCYGDRAMSPNPPLHPDPVDAIHKGTVDEVGVIVHVAMPIPFEPDDAADDLPFVILDDDVAELPPASSAIPSVTAAALDRWHRAAMSALPTHAAAQALLADCGCADPAVQAAWRMGAPDPACLDGLDADDEAALHALGIPTSGPGWKSMMRGGGVVIPSFLPADPTRVVGLVRLTPAQHKHAMLTTPPLGLGGTRSAFISPTPILVLGVPLALRLAGVGLSDVLLVENTEQLANCATAFVGKSLRLVAGKSAEMDALRAALITVAAEIPCIDEIVVPPGLHGMAADTITRLGIDPAHLPTPEPAPPRTPTLFRDLTVYAQQRLAGGLGRDALEAAGLNQPDLITTYGIGYLPSDYQNALDRTSRRALVGTRLGGSLLIPATDDQGHIVDGLLVYQGGARRDRPLAPEPAGLLGGALVTAHADVVLTDTVSRLARLWRAGYRNVLLVRGIEDVSRNVERMVRAGVTHATLHLRHAEERVADLLRHAGISVSVGLAISDDDATTIMTAPVVPILSLNEVPTAASSDDETLPVVIVEDDDPA